MTFGAADSGESFLEIAAFEVIVNHFRDNRTKEPVFLVDVCGHVFPGLKCRDQAHAGGDLSAVGPDGLAASQGLELGAAPSMLSSGAPGLKSVRHSVRLHSLRVRLNAVPPAMVIGWWLSFIVVTVHFPPRKKC